MTGTSNDSWTGGSIVSQLNSDRLVKIQHCFQDLQPQVKLKLLLSFFHIPRRNLEQWRRELENILTVAKDDSEPWVCMLAELMKTFPGKGNKSVSNHQIVHRSFLKISLNGNKILKILSNGNKIFENLVKL